MKTRLASPVGGEEPAAGLGVILDLSDVFSREVLSFLDGGVRFDSFRRLFAALLGGEILEETSVLSFGLDNILKNKIPNRRVILTKPFVRRDYNVVVFFNCSYPKWRSIMEKIRYHEKGNIIPKLLNEVVVPDDGDILIRW